MKLDLFHLVDWLDSRILRHRFRSVCQWIARLEPEGPPCLCAYCRSFQPKDIA